MKKTYVYSSAAALAAGCLILMLLGRPVQADDRPTTQAIASAQKSTDLMQATLFAALSQEFAETTADNVDEGKKSISLIFNDLNKDMRLVGLLNPIRPKDIPQDLFESLALARAMHGQDYTDVDRVDGKWYYRRSIPLGVASSWPHGQRGQSASDISGLVNTLSSM